MVGRNNLKSDEHLDPIINLSNVIGSTYPNELERLSRLLGW